MINRIILMSEVCPVNMNIHICIFEACLVVFSLYLVYLIYV